MDPTQPSSCRLTSLPQRHFLRNLSFYPKLYNLETIGIKTNTSCSSTYGETQIKPERKTDFARLAILRKETAGWFLKRAFQFYPHVFSMEIAFVVTLSGLLTLSLAGQRSAGRPPCELCPLRTPAVPVPCQGSPSCRRPGPRRAPRAAAAGRRPPGSWLRLRRRSPRGAPPRFPLPCPLSAGSDPGHPSGSVPSFPSFVDRFEWNGLCCLMSRAGKLLPPIFCPIF